MSITPSRRQAPFQATGAQNTPISSQDSDSVHVTLVQEKTDALIILDRDGIVRFADRRAENIFAGGQPLVGKPSPIPVKAGEHALPAGPSGQKRFIDVRIADSDWQGAPAYVASVSDITARKIIENAPPHEAPTPAADPSFFSDLSHALRTSLTDIVGFSELMKDERLGPLTNEKYKDYVADIHASSLQLLQVIDQALDAAQDGKHAPEKPNALCFQDVARLAAHCRRADASCAFQVEAPDDLYSIEVFGDRDRLIQAFRLLLSDAARNSEADDPARLSATCGDDFLSVEIENSWRGFSDADLANMLDDPSANSADVFALNPTKQRMQKTSDAFIGMKRMVDLFGGTFAILGNGHNGVRLRIKLKTTN